MEKEIVYFELNNWCAGRDYPDNARFIYWMSDDENIKFIDPLWVETNGLCVVWQFVDMSDNFCISAPKEWVEKNCPELLTTYKKFLRYPDSAWNVYGRFGTKFLEYTDTNIGIHELGFI